MYFAILVIANIAFIIVLIVFTIIDFNDELGSQRDEIIPYAHSTFSALVSVLFFYFGLMIGQMIELASKESHQHQNVDYYLEEEGDSNQQESQINIIQANKNNKESPLINSNKSNETYLTTRKQQLYLITISNLITDCLEFLLGTFELFVFPKGFSFSVATVPINATGYSIFALQQLSMLSSGLFTFIAFYYVVRDSYETHHKRETVNLGMEEFNPNTQAKSNSNITDYLTNV